VGNPGQIIADKEGKEAADERREKRNEESTENAQED
jgi:hypothetical protein